MSLSLNNQVSRIKPLYEYLKKQRDNYQFIRTVEISATFILITFFMLFAIKPTILTISSLWGEIQSKQLLKSQLGTKIDNVVKAQDIFSQIQERYQVVDDSLPDRPKFSDVASQIQQTGTNSGLNVSSFDYSIQSGEQTPFAPNVKDYQISLSLTGSFPAVSQTISNLLANRRLINIDSIGIGLSQPGSVTASFLSSYYYWSP